MKIIIEPSSITKSFDYLNIGQHFEYVGGVYLKLSTSHAFSLGGNCIREFNPGVQVVKLMIRECIFKQDFS